MDFGRGLSYMRQDPNWIVKILLGSVISFVPILNFASSGYGLDVMRNVYAGREAPLPEWGENFGDRWVRGLIGTVIAFIYTLPLLVFVCLFSAATGGMAASVDPEQATNAGPPTAILCLFPLIIVVGLIFGIMGMIATARYAITNNFGEAMRFGAVWATFRNGLGRWLGLIVMLVLVSIVFGLGAIITCGLGFLF